MINKVVWFRLCEWMAVSLLHSTKCGILPPLQFRTDSRAFNNLLVQAQFLTESPNSFDGIFFVVSDARPHFFPNYWSLRSPWYCIWWWDDQRDSVLITMPPRKISSSALNAVTDAETLTPPDLVYCHRATLFYRAQLFAFSHTICMRVTLKFLNEIE